ncbi:hypothetical protein DPX16_21982 [Anabarilius grahami]|uniref:Uncharacterized protein n=1 Tax=Anabarilius grahami TaxID=495550 RepID=A0A3N0XQ50_ANAGA|nr:hypothetical protein DPX16_21982 [Anabarilius grahami]
MEWVLVNNNSPITIGPAEDDSITSPTPPLPETSHPPLTATSTQFPVPTADRGDRPAAMHYPTTVDEMLAASGTYLEVLKDIFEVNLIDVFGEVDPNPPVSPELPVSPAPSLSPAFPVFPEFPPSRPLPPPQSTSSSAAPPLLSFSPSASPTCGEDLPSVFRTPAPSSTGDHLSPPPASVPITPPRPVDTLAPPWLLPPSAPPESIGHTASPGSLVTPAPLWSAVDLPVPSVLSGSGFPLVTPPSSVPPAQPLFSGYPSPTRMLVATAPPRSPVPSVSRGLIDLSAPPGSPSLVVVPSPVIPRVHSKSSTPWLLPPSTPPWGLVLAGLWLYIWLLLLQAPPWILPPSTPHSPMDLYFGLVFVFPLSNSSPSSRAPSLLY